MIQWNYSTNRRSSEFGCRKPIDPGPCEALILRFGYNSETGQCESFTYGGCQGNRNRFDTLKQCQEICEVCDLAQCLVDPCDHATCCADPSATCVADYCGGCNADFYVGNRKVNCDRTTCPEPGFGICIYACADDASCSGCQKCCSNGCGLVCMDPALP